MPTHLKDKIAEKFGNRIRIRVCGLLMEDKKLLLIKHKGIGDEGVLWIPPGGGVEMGSGLHENLIREFHEETGLDVTIKELLFTTEYIKPPLHAIELFFSVALKGGTLKKGIDPEMPQGEQIISEVMFLSEAEVMEISPTQLHHSFEHVRDDEGAISFKRFFNFKDKYLN